MRLADRELAKAYPDERSKSKTDSGNTAAAFKGAVIGSAGAFLLSMALYSGKPAEASATMLLPSLGTIITQITTYYQLMVEYVDKWAPGLPGIIDHGALGEFGREQKTINNAFGSASKQHASYHADGEDPPVSAVKTLLAPMQLDNGETDPEKAAQYLVPPAVSDSGDITDRELNRIRDHSLILTGDQPIPQVSDEDRGTLTGVDYEYRRLRLIQQRLLAQEAITQYPLFSPKLAGYHEYLEDMQSAGTSGSMEPGQLLNAQLDILAQVAVPASIDGLESELRQERLLGAQLAAIVNRYQDVEGDRLARRGR